MKVLGICGSLQAESANLSLLHKAASIAPTGMEIVIFDGIRHLPPFNPALEGSGAPIGSRGMATDAREQ